MDELTSAERAAHYIRQLIFMGELPAGARVPQEAVARQLGMSRIPVREALAALEAEGRVSIVANRGAFVATLTRQTAEDTVDVSMLLYSFAGRRAIERMTPEFLGQLIVAHAEVALAEDPIALHRAFEAFHLTIARGAIAGRVLRLIEAFQRQVPDTVYRLDSSLPAVIKDLAARQLAALASGDAEQYDCLLDEQRTAIRHLVLEPLAAAGLVVQ
jgi:DNA-binding GntR family transcriptional regulator